METMIPADDPVRLLNAFVEGMDLSELYATYDRIRKNQATPRQMLKIMLYASMNRLFSSRDIETACKRDVNFMYLLEGMPAPDHATIARFISRSPARPYLLMGQKSNPAQISIHLSGKSLLQSIRLACLRRLYLSSKNVRPYTGSKWSIMAKRHCIP